MRWRPVSTILLVVEDAVYRAQAHVKMNCNVGQGEFENLMLVGDTKQQAACHPAAVHI